MCQITSPTSQDKTSPIRHFNERLNIYKQENFNYEINRVKLMNYQVVKLSNGEDIICKVIRTIDGSITIKISYPLKMETYNRSTEKGVVESLGLSRWVQPYSDEQIVYYSKNNDCYDDTS